MTSSSPQPDPLLWALEAISNEREKLHDVIDAMHDTVFSAVHDVRSLLLSGDTITIHDDLGADHVYKVESIDCVLRSVTTGNEVEHGGAYLTHGDELLDDPARTYDIGDPAPGEYELVRAWRRDGTELRRARRGTLAQFMREREQIIAAFTELLQRDVNSAHNAMERFTGWSLELD